MIYTTCLLHVSSLRYTLLYICVYSMYSSLYLPVYTTHAPYASILFSFSFSCLSALIHTHIHSFFYTYHTVHLYLFLSYIMVSCVFYLHYSLTSCISLSFSFSCLSALIFFCSSSTVIAPMAFTASLSSFCFALIARFNWPITLKASANFLLATRSWAFSTTISSHSVVSRFITSVCWALRVWKGV